MKKRSLKQRMLVIILAASMFFTMTPVTSYAEEMNDDQAGVETSVDNVYHTENEVSANNEAGESLQSRIDQLPTVEEFIAMADGTTVEDSTLNQAQMDVYYEAQAIADEMESLTEEELGMLDISRLEALFAYFNGQVVPTLDLDYSRVKTYGLTFYPEGNVKSVDIEFCWPRGNQSADVSLVLLNHDIGNEDLYKQYNQLYTTYEASLKGISGAVSYSKERQYHVIGDNICKATFTFGESDIDINKNASYYLYLWTYFNNHYYPDARILEIRVQDGKVSYRDGSLSSGYQNVAVKHTHSWEYTANANIIEAKCNATENPCDYHTNAARLILNAEESASYSGRPYTGATCNNGITSVTGAPAEIHYVGRGSTDYQESVIAPVNTGTYTAKVTMGGVTATADFEIQKATGRITNISDISKTYDGTPVNEPAYTLEDAGNDAKVTISYKKQGTDDSTYTSEAPKLCGKYVVRIVIGEDSNHNEVAVTKEFSIDKRQIEFTADGYSGIYDGLAHGIEVNVTDPADAADVKVFYGTRDILGNITYSENKVTYKNAGSYTVFYKITADNYEDITGYKIVDIAPKTVDLVWSDDDFTYDGRPHVPEAKVNEDDIMGSDEVGVIVSGEQINAGHSYMAEATALDNDNYKFIGPETKTFKIKPATAIVTIDNATKHIGKDDPAFTYKTAGLIEGDTLQGIALSRTEGETVGDYDITAAEIPGSNPNYDVTMVKGKLTIEDHMAVVDKAVAATCTETGLTEGSHCSVCGKVFVSQEIVDALGHEFSEWVKAGNREKAVCERCGRTKYRNIEDLNDRGIEKDVEVAFGSPIAEAVIDNSRSELLAADGIFTAEEKSAIEGGADARVWLEISETSQVSDEDRQKIKTEAEKIMGNDISKLVYFDVNMFKSVTKDGSTTRTQITEPGIDVIVSINLPASLLQTDSTILRSYKIIRLHNGAVDSIDASFDKETGTLTFKTDRFSTYAIGFTDTQIATTNTISTSDNQNQAAGAGNADQHFAIPKTGDSSPVMLWTILFLLSVMGLAGLLFRKNRMK